MEKVDFLDDIKLKETIYLAVFDPDTGDVLSVGPDHAFADKKNIIKIEKDIAEMVIEGEINICNCAVDVRNLTFELLEKKVVNKIDDILHRVIDKNWTSIDNPDIYITVDTLQSTITIELTEEFNGTFILPEKYQPVNRRHIIWDGDTALNFYITEYNDPNILYSSITILLKDLVGSKITKSCETLPKKFSIYTRRVLKNYVLEIK